MKSYILTYMTALKVQIMDIWNRSKIAILAIAALLLAFEFNKIKTMILSYFNQKEIKQTEVQDNSLKAQENTENTTANQLVQEANSLPSTEKPVTLDWNKK